MKKSVRTAIAFLVFVSLQLTLLGQNPTTFQCASDEVMQSRPELLERQQALEKAILQRHKNGSLEKSGTPPYTLPVVVHIIHDNGVGDIPDAQVFNAIEQLNQAFAHQGYYADQGAGYDTQIQFCLAKRDPDGNATNGITRTSSALTNLDKDFEDQELKDLSRWNPNDCINVWVVNAINSTSSGPGVAGYAYLASAHGQPFDGIVCEAAYFGTSPKNNVVLIHEMGHFLNLYHTFQGGCKNDDCLTDGDRVCDTPPDQVTFSACGFNSCETDVDDASANNPFTSDMADMTENYMDYSPFECYHAFTAGQAERMYEAIEFARSSLLESDRCKSPCDDVLMADFSASATSIMSGSSVDFQNLSMGGTAFEWRVNGDLFSTDADASFTFLGSGIFEITLVALNDDPNCSSESSVFIQVICGVEAGFAVNDGELEVGETLVCTNTSTGAINYQWLINGVPVGTDANLNYIFSNVGDYTITLEAYGPFCTDYYSKNVSVSSGVICQDSVTGVFYQLTNNQLSYLSYGDMLPNGDLYLNAYFPSEAGMIIKTDAMGNLIWQKKIAIPSNGLELFATNDGGCVARYGENNLTETHILKTDADGNALWVRKTGPNFTLRPFGNGALVFHESINPPVFETIGLGGSGNVRWNNKYSMGGGIKIMDARPTYDGGGFWLVGHGSFDQEGALIMKMDTLGNLLFAKRFHKTIGNHLEFRHVAATPDNGFIAVGRETYSNSLDNDFLILKGDANGEQQWNKKIGMDAQGNIQESAYQLFVKPNGGYIGQYTILGQEAFWYSFSESGVLEYMNQLRWEDGSLVPFGFDVKNGKIFFNSQSNINTYSITVSEFDPVTGPLVGCFGVLDHNASTVTTSLLQTDISFSLSSPTNAVANVSYTELPADHEILKVPFCVEQVDCLEACDNSLDDDDDGFVDCFDPDCVCSNGEDCNGISQITFPPIQAKVGWLTGENWANMTSTPIVANLDPQNGPIPEIIVAEGTPDHLTVPNISKILIYQGDGSNASSPDILEIPEQVRRGNATPVVGDINGDGIPELAIVTADRYIRVYSNFSAGNAQAMTPFAVSDYSISRQKTHLGMADFDGDGIPEIYGENYIFKFDLTNPASPLLIRSTQGLGHSGIIGNASQSNAFDLLSPADCNGDPDCEGLELIAGAYIYSVDLDPLDGDGIQIKVARNLHVLAFGNDYSDGYSYVADLNLDGVPDIATTGTTTAFLGPDTITVNGIYVWDKNGLLEILEYPSISDQFSSISIANVFDDREAGFALDFPEIIATTNDEIISYNLQAAQATPDTPYWWIAPFDDFTGSAGSTCFDLNGDGLSEIICRDGKYFRILYGGALPLPPGVASDRTWWKMECNSQTDDESPIVVDIDMDGEAEILVTGYLPPYLIGQPDYRGRVWVIESDTTPWLPARPIWNQFNYFGLHVNDDLTIPKQQQPNHLEFPGLGSGKRPFNIANSQLPSLDNNFNPYFPVSDATVEVDSILCDLDSLDLWFTICNQGSRVLPDSTPVSIYQNNPTTGTATIITTSLTTSALSVDSCFTFYLKIPAIYNTPIFVLVNDNGTLATPFDPAIDFPNTGVLECDYENNLAQFEWSHQNPMLDLGPDISTCNSSTNTLNAGDGFAKYRWQDGSEDSIFTAWEPGKYWVDVWDVCGFKLTDTVIIALDQSAAIDLGDDLNICKGETVSLTVNGYTDVQWWPAEGLSCIDCPSVDASPTTTVTYYATGREGNCFSTDSIHITVFPKPDFEFSTTSSGCNQPTLIEVISNSNEALEYVWSNGETGPSIQISQSGNYWVTATNNVGCQTVDSIYAIPTGIVEFTVSTKPILCFGETGSIHLNILQSAPPYQILWSTGESADSLTNLPPGVYGVLVTDSNGCFASETFIMDDPAELTIAPTASNISCNNDPGQIALNADGGTGPLSYLWSNGATTPSISTVTPGNYAATITDANGCSTTFEQNLISEPLPLAVSILFTEIQCPGGMDGSATLLPLNGTPPFLFEWGNGQTDSIQTDLGSEPHSVTITDALGCKKEIAFNLIEPDSLAIEISASSVQCFGEMNGSASASVMGGSPGYHYLWSNGVTAPTIGNLAPGQYFLTISDDHGCQDSAAILIEEPPLLNLVALANPTQICPDETSELSASVMGGTPPYSYEWNGTLSDSLLENAPAGMYEIMVTDANGCTAAETIVVDAFSLPDSIQIAIQPATGTMASDGAIIVEEIFGGIPPFSYLWSNGATTQSIDNLSPSTYSLTLMDGAGCQSFFEYEVEVMVATGEKNASLFSVALFPNPVFQNGDAVLSFRNNLSQRFEISLFDMTGRLLKKEQVQMGVGAFTQSIQAPNASGLFLIQIIGEDGRRVYFRWVVVRE
ncbi:MAG: M43 family zinc metalloprotease [Saprospiraceae bacterium]